MIKDNQRVLNRVNILVDACAAFGTLLLAHWIRFDLMPGAHVSVPYSAWLKLAGASTLLHLMMNSFMGLYRLERRSSYRSSARKILASETLCLLVLISGLFVLNLNDISRWTIVIHFALQLGFMLGKLAGKRAILRHFRRKGYNLKHIVLIGAGETARSYYAAIAVRPWYGYHVTGYFAPEPCWDELDYLGTYDALPAALSKRNPDEAIIALPPEEYTRMAQAIRACEQSGTRLHIVPCYDKYVSSQIEAETVEGVNLLDIRRIPLDLVSNAFIKRATDIVSSLLLIALASPLMLVAAVGTRLSSPGPVIFKQERVGKNKKLFMMYKFRSMRVNDREQTGWSGRADDRRTAFGAFLRRYSIDELPQLFNVLRGQMSLVGPRPELPHFVEQFRDEVPLYMLKHCVKPGMTGWAQVNGLRGDTSIRARVEHDIYYIENWTWGFDVKILLMTLLHLKNDEQSAKQAHKEENA